MFSPVAVKLRVPCFGEFTKNTIIHNASNREKCRVFERTLGSTSKAHIASEKSPFR
jgi:hypothetical protein